MDDHVMRWFFEYLLLDVICHVRSIWRVINTSIPMVRYEDLEVVSLNYKIRMP